MIKYCSLYLFQEKPDLKSMFPGGRTDGGFLKKATWFEFDSESGPVRLTLQHPDLTKHLRGFSAYVAQLPNSGAARAKAQLLIKGAKAALGADLPQPVALDSHVLKTLLGIAERCGGFLFAADSIMLPDGSFVVGRLAQDTQDGAPTPRLLQVDPSQYKHQGAVEGVDPERAAEREEIYCRLAERGFRCSRWLPLLRSENGLDSLRPLKDIAGRLLALNALFLWASAPEDIAASSRIRAFVERDALYEHLVASERAILDLPRQQARAGYAHIVGWRLENMWPLAWIIGFDPAPPFYVGQMPNEVTRAMILDFLPDLDASLAQFLSGKTPRMAKEVSRLEDTFYCAHNAVRSAQTGADTVPQDFHPVRDGGAVHERRHSLTWAVSPGVDWDDTDLST
ncbi:MAG TPA: DUF4272 domain-containing protein [Burkholderiaceae bacterium]